MALITCPDCSREVSPSASACPGCGRPMSRADSGAGSQLYTTQETSKRLKVHMIISVVSISLGIVLVTAGFQSPTPEESGALPSGILLTIAGLIWFVVTRLRIWWHHK